MGCAQCGPVHGGPPAGPPRRCAVRTTRVVGVGRRQAGCCQLGWVCGHAGRQERATRTSVGDPPSWLGAETLLCGFQTVGVPNSPAAGARRRGTPREGSASGVDWLIVGVRTGVTAARRGSWIAGSVAQLLTAEREALGLVATLFSNRCVGAPIVRVATRLIRVVAWEGGATTAVMTAVLQGFFSRSSLGVVCQPARGGKWPLRVGSSLWLPASPTTRRTRSTRVTELMIDVCMAVWCGAPLPPRVTAATQGHNGGAIHGLGHQSPYR